MCVLKLQSKCVSIETVPEMCVCVETVPEISLFQKIRRNKLLKPKTQTNPTTIRPKIKPPIQIKTNSNVSRLFIQKNPDAITNNSTNWLGYLLDHVETKYQ